MNETEILQSVISEYKSILVRIGGRTEQPLRIENLIRELCRSHDWTDNGAGTVVSLANDYGVFMLRNALALAIALGKEDGELNF
jgi:3-hydroxyisobutyrate dehydrogenase-like beta-hydroxyacid dehydrogenase